MFWKKKKFEGLDELSSRSRQYTREDFHDDGIVSVHINSTGPAAINRKLSDESLEAAAPSPPEHRQLEPRAMESRAPEYRQPEFRPRMESTPIRHEPVVRAVSPAAAPVRQTAPQPLHPAPQPLHAAPQPRPVAAHTQPLRAVETAERLERIESRLQSIEHRIERLDQTMHDLIGVLEKVPVEYLVSVMESRSSTDQIERLAGLLEGLSNKISAEPEAFAGSNGRRVRPGKRKSADIQSEMFLD